MNIDLINETPSVNLTLKVKELENTGKKIAKLQTGEPFFKTHPNIIKFSKESIEDQNLRYSVSQGELSLRKKISQQNSGIFMI